MSRKVSGNGPVKMTASTSKRGRIPALLGILTTMVRRGRRKRTGRTDLEGGIAVPRGIRLAHSQTVHVVGSDLRLLR
ncbi:MAG: hypothetical protein ACE5KQ_03805 [Thermoplasmata archaeon]